MSIIILKLSLLIFILFSDQLKFKQSGASLSDVKISVNRTHVHIFKKPPLSGHVNQSTTNPAYDNSMDQYANCIENFKKQHPHLARRFNDMILARNCRRFRLWAEHLANVEHERSIVNLTEDQMDYVQKIQLCHTKTGCFGSKKYHNKTKRQSGHRVIRKECRTLSPDQFQAWHRALRTLKETYIDSRSKYDLIVFYHLPQTAPAAHFGPSFLPYHRELLKQLELGLRGVDPNVALCYWDSTLDHDLPNPADSALWTPQLLGNGQGYVTTGPFANWPTPSIIPEVNRNRLYRTVGAAAGADALYNRQDIDRFMQLTTFEKLAVYCQDPTFEILHGGGHDFVGGHMTYLATSPNDPVFFLHHTFIDYFWELWREKHQNLHQRETEYPPDGPQSCGVQYQGDSQMKPFNMKNKDGLGNNYHGLYTYAPSPNCNNGLCHGDYLFCNTNTGFCSAKVRPGGDCTNLEQFDSCFNSECVSGRCGQSDASIIRRQGQNAVADDDVIVVAATPATDDSSTTAVADDPVTAAVAPGAVTEAATEQSNERDAAQQQQQQQQQPDTLLAMINTDSIDNVISVTDSLS